MKIKWTNSREEERILIKNVSLNYSQKNSVPTQQYFNGAYIEEKVHDITTKIRQRKNKWHVPIKKNFRTPSIWQNMEIILCTLFLILIYLSLVEIWKECWMMETTEKQYKQCTSFFGRHISSSLLMFKCWVIVLVFHNILNFMIQIKKFQFCFCRNHVFLN